MENNLILRDDALECNSDGINFIVLQNTGDNDRIYCNTMLFFIFYFGITTDENVSKRWCYANLACSIRTKMESYIVDLSLFCLIV